MATLKKHIVILMILTILVSPSKLVEANSSSAQKLYELGLLSNISGSELNAELNRIIGLTMILKSLGYKEADARKSEKSHAFEDLIGDNAWGIGWVNIGIDKSITTGISKTRFSPNSTLSKKEFLSFQLRVLGYGIEESWNNCANLAIQAGLIQDTSAIIDYSFSKGEAADIMYAALNARLKSNTDITWVEQMVKDGIISKDIALAQNIYGLNRLIMKSVQPVSNTRLEVLLEYAVTVVNKEDILLVDSLGNKVTINDTLISQDGKTITLLTGSQKVFVKHTLTIDGKFLSYNPYLTDGGLPRVLSAAAINHTSVRVIFSEKVDESALLTRFYNISGLSILKAAYELDSSGVEIKTNIILTTSTQTQNAAYTVSTIGIKDLSGNVIDSGFDEVQFLGKGLDVTRPRIHSVYPLNNTTLRVIFSEIMDEASIETLSNFASSGVTLYKAEMQSNNAIVYLTTSPLINGYIYKLEINSVRDVSGNLIDSEYNVYSFVGIGVDTVKPILVSAVSTSNTTVKVTFNEPISDESNIAQMAYDLGELGYPSKVIKDTITTDGTVWILTTMPQLLKTYLLDVTGVQDLAGNVLNEEYDTISFIGMK